MKERSLLLVTLSLLLVLGLGGGIGGLWAKEPAPPGKVTAQAAVGTAFTYQGHLLKDDSPVNDTCNFKFSLYDSINTLLDVYQSDASVEDGLFTVQVDFGPDHFTGEARLVEIAVKCSGDGTHTPLLPRQELTATPYALSLRPEAKVAGATAAVDDAILTVENTGMGIGLKVDGASYGIRSSGYFGVHGDGAVGVEGIGSYGVAGYSDSSTGYGVYGENTGGGVAIYAGGSGIIKSDAETHLAINPFEIEATSELANNLTLSFLHHWLGYTEVKNDSNTGSSTIYAPVHNLTTLFGTSLKLKSLEVCYKCSLASSYISQTKVYYADNSGGRTQLLTSDSDRSSTSWTCYTVSTGSPIVIDGPMLVYFNLYFFGTGDTHKITIGRMIATLVE